MSARFARVVLCSLALIARVAAAQSPELKPAQPPQPRPSDARSEVTASGLSKLPRQTKFVEAEYPKDAMRDGLEADVILLLDIGADGKVGTVGIAEPSAFPGKGFEEAAMAAASGFEFEPAEQAGTKIAVQITYRYKFRLAPKKAEQAAPAAAAKPAPSIANFTGVLVERGTRTPLAGALVTVFRQDESGAPIGFEATSDADGRFVFRDLTPGEWKVSIEPPGYYPFKTAETVTQTEVVTVTYYLERGTYNPYDVTVSAPRPRKEVSRTVLTAAEIDKVPGTAGDPLNVVQNFAGVARPSPQNQGQFVVRGSAPEDSRIFVNGAEVPIMYHFGGIRGVLPIGVLDRLDFYPGNFSPEFGRATGGIIDVRVKKLQPKHISGYADLSLLDASVFVEVPLGDKGGIAIGGRRSYLDAVVKAAVPKDADVNVVSAPVYYDYQLLANYRPAPAHEFRAFVFGSDDRLKLLFKDPADIDPTLTGNNASSATSFYRSQLGYEYRPNSSFENSLELSQGRNWLSFSFAQLMFKLQTYNAQVRDTVRHTFSDEFALSYGVDFLFARGRVTARLPPRPHEGEPPPSGLRIDEVFYTDAERTFVSPAGYATLEVKPLPGWLLLPGVRVDQFGAVHQAVVQPRFTTRYQIDPKVTLKGGVGLFARAPEFDRIDENFGNPDLHAERAMHYSVGVEVKPEPFLLFDVTGFYKQLFDLVSPTDKLTTRNGMQVPMRYDNGGSGRVYGAEITIRHEFAHGFTGWLAYTLSRAERHDSGVTGNRLFDFDQTHILNVIASYLLPHNFEVGVRYRLISGDPRTPVVSSIFDASADRYDPVYGPVNSARNGLFHQLDLRVDKRWIYDSFILSAYLDVQNVYAHENDEGRTYNFDFSQSQRASGLPILPILGLRAEF